MFGPVHARSSDDDGIPVGPPARWGSISRRTDADDIRLSKEDRNGRERWDYDQWDSKS